MFKMNNNNNFALHQDATWLDFILKITVLIFWIAANVYWDVELTKNR